MVVKGKMTVKPEVVGGNGEMFYRWKTTKTSSWQEVNTKFMDGNDNYDDADFDNTNDYVNQDALTINTVGGSAALITHDTAWFIANSTDNGTGFAINYEIWDSTDGKTKYSTDAATASNKVSINITGIDLQVRDKAAPVVTIDDFYWNSLSDNSVYTSKAADQVKSVSDLEGHIELHDQLPDTFLATGATDTEFDRDDKVSGKIKLKGTVSDNIVLTDLYLLIDGMTDLTTSTKVATYDMQPEMSAPEVCENVLKAIENPKYQFILVNFANPDMVGHTGVIEAATKACHVVDECVGKIADACKQNGIVMLLTADHGNSETMVNEQTGKPHIAHTTNEVPFVLINAPQGTELKETGKLCDVAPTVLQLLGIEQPKEMTGETLIK